MIKIEKYTGDKIYMWPSGALATQDAVLQQFPAALTFVHIAETDPAGEVLFAVQNLAAVRGLYDLPDTLTEAEAIAAIEEIRNTPPEVVPSAEDRIAAALEYQNLLTF